MFKEKTKKKLYEIIFEADTREGKMFDIGLLIVISISILAVLLESVREVNEVYGNLFLIIEWICTIVFTIEYVLRILVVQKPKNYIFSFYGIIDFLSILPSYIGLILVGSNALIIIRSIRLLRIFRVLKLVRFLGEAEELMQSLRASSYKISVFLITVLTFTTIFGTIMYQVEGPENGFVSIPVSIYWAIVTLTTVGFGDITPHTALGKFIASIIMILGYGIIAVPTGLVTAQLIKKKIKTNTQTCSNCMADEHDNDAVFCKHCGTKL